MDNLDFELGQLLRVNQLDRTLLFLGKEIGDQELELLDVA